MSYYQPSLAEVAERRAALAEFDRWNERALLAAWALMGRPETYIDFGSGSGAMVGFARRCGVDAKGVDIIAQPPDIIHDLRRPLDLKRKFQLATSIETAEHLTPESSDDFCQTVNHHLIHDGGWFIFTAALPGQPGEHHVNLIPPFEWRARFTKAGLTYHAEATVRLALLWLHTTGPMHHLAANLQVFVKGTP